MKKLTIGLGILLSGLASTAWGAYPTGTSACGVTVPSYCGGFTFGVTGLYWRPSAANREFGTTLSNADITDIEDFDDISVLSRTHRHSLDHDFDWGFKANVGYVFPCSGNDVRLTYTHFNSSDDDKITEFPVPSLAAINVLNDPLFGPTFSFVSSDEFLFVLPVNVILDSKFFDINSVSGSLSASSRFQNKNWDLDFGQAINVGCNFNFRLFAGLRYSKIEHRLDTTSEISASGVLTTHRGTTVFTNITVGVLEGPPNFNSEVQANLLITNAADTLSVLDVALEDVVHRNHKFEGLGPRVGFDINYQFCGGFGLVGGIASALLIGHFNNDVIQHLTGSGTFESSPLPLAGSIHILLTPPTSGQITFEDSVVNPVDKTISFDHPEETRVVPNIDLKLGLDYTYQFCNCSRTRLTVEAGYEINHYFNAIDKFGVDDLSDCSNTLDVSFDGPYVSVQVTL